MLNKENVKDIIPLSPMQEGMLFHYLCDDDCMQYFEYIKINMDYTLENYAYYAAWNSVFNNNEMLNVVFRWENLKKTVQILMKNTRPSIVIKDFSQSSDEKSMNELDCAVTEKIKSDGIDLTKCCIKIVLCKFNKSSTLHIVYHHILLDGWSLGIILKEFMDAYDAILNNRTYKPVMKASFKEYYQKVYLNKNNNEDEYWNKLLNNYEVKHFCKPLYSNDKKDKYESIKKEIPLNIVNKLINFTKENNVSLAAIIYSVWGFVSAKFLNTDDIVFGTTVSGRDVDIKFIENSVGLYINTVPLRIKLANGTSVKEYIQNVQFCLNNRRAYEKTSLININKYAKLEGGKNIFDSIVVIENYPLDKEYIDKMHIKKINIQEYTNYPMTLTVDLMDGIKVELVYESKLYEDFLVDELMSAFENVIDNMMDNCEMVINKVQTLKETKQNQVIYEFNDTESDYPSEENIINLFNEQVLKNPDKEAVIYGDKIITYGELNKKSDSLATLLSQKGVGNDSIVGIIGHKSIEIIIAIFGILKTGAAYVPINPEYPDERKKLILNETKAKIVVVNNDINFQTECGYEVVDLRDKQIYSRYSRTEKVVNSSTSNSMVCVIYTSGSTGTPKGIMIKNKGILRLVKNTNFANFNNSDKILSTAPIEFDASILEIWGSLLNGGTLYILDKYKMLMPGILKRYIEEYSITKMWMTAPLFNEMVQSDITIFEKLKYLIIGGATLSVEHVNKVKKMYKWLNLVNGYGPAENTVCSTYHVINEEYIYRVPIGKPISNSTAYILDKDKNPVPVGAVGELYVGKDGVTCGYLNNSELTNNCFVDDPFLKEGKMYKTGDLARWLPDGTIDFLGRVDYQVKIRGIRIEIEEIEGIIKKHKKVNECVVLVKKVKNKEKELAAYVCGNNISREEIKDYLNLNIPRYYIPSYIIMVNEIPLTINGKVDRNALLNIEHSDDTEEKYIVESLSETESKVINIWKEVLNVKSIGVNDNFFDIGGNSLNTIQVVSKIKSKFGKEIQVIDLFKYTTVKSLSEFISNRNNENNTLSNEEYIGGNKGAKGHKDIAIIGISGKFPGANNIDQFWDNITSGVESISFFTEEELREYGEDYSMLRNKKYVKAKGVLNDIECFDPELFSYTNREAEFMDPQTRLLHQCTWSVLEDAGYDSDIYNGKIGMFIGGNLNIPWLIKLSSQLTDPTEKWEASNINIQSLSTPISYKLNLTGPSITIKTACSSSLAAVHIACRSIMNGECNMAVAGGCSVSLPKKAGYLYQEGMIRSSDGHCRAFDKDANGTVGGDGIGLVLLKDLNDAVKDGDHIYAVIKGSASNNDGCNKIGFTAPSLTGQAKVIRDAQLVGNIDPKHVTYVEAHGTGTPLGDTIEIEALKKAFNTEKRNYCALGSVKTNIGHLDAASGIAGLIKTVLSLHHKLIPPSLNYKEENPKMNINKSPFYVNTKLKEWKDDKYPLTAGVSSFGIGGTNVHVVLQEFNEDKIKKVEEVENINNIILLSAKNKSALTRQMSNLLNYLYESNEKLEDIAYTLQVGRKMLEEKVAFIVKNKEQLIKDLENVLKGEEYDLYNYSTENHKKVVFMFPGQGSQYVEMGRELYNNIEFFRNKIDKLFSITEKFIDFDIKKIWLNNYIKETKDNIKDINETEVAQLLIFIMEYSLASLIRSFGIEPDIMIGHSLGEYTAACISGVFSVEDALKIVFSRASLMQQMKRGSMVSVVLDLDSTKELIANCKDVYVAASNSSNITVVSGTFEGIDNCINILNEKGISYVKLHVSHAFHSSMMNPMLQKYKDVLSTITLNKPTIPYISNLTGTYITNKQATDPNYYLEHILNTVHFKQGIDTLAKDENTVYLEVGPGIALTKLVSSNDSVTNNNCFIHIMRQAKQKLSDEYVFYKAIAQMWIFGVKIDWNLFNANKIRNRVSLPQYSFEKNYYWKYGNKVLSKENKENKEIIKNKEEWFYTPKWSRKGLISTPIEKSLYIVFDNDDEEGSSLMEFLSNTNNIIIRINKGYKFSYDGNNKFVINSNSLEDYNLLLSEIKRRYREPDKIIYLWSEEKLISNFEDYTDKYIENEKQISLFNIINIAKAVAINGINNDIDLIIITKNMESVLPDDDINPFKALIKGVVNVIPLEYKNINTLIIDTDTKKNYYKELIFDSNKDYMKNCRNIAYRNGNRYELSFREVSIKKNYNKQAFKDRGVYLITGGLGGIGLVIADYLVTKYNANIVLVSRSGLPSVENWNDENLESNIKAKIRKIRDLENKGSKVLICKADVSDYDAMKKVVNYCENNLGYINGIIHAAGVTDSGILQNSTRKKIDKEMVPKLNGTLVIHKIVSEMDREKSPQIILFSSLSSILGALGQTGYIASNAFVDSYAQWALKNGLNVCAINWDRWKETGMAFNSMNNLVKNKDIEKRQELEVKDNILLSSYVEGNYISGIKIEDNSVKSRTYISKLSKEKDWVLREHKIGNNTVLSGTTYIQIIVSCLNHYGVKGTIEIKEIFFLNPMFVLNDVEIRVLLSDYGDKLKFIIASKQNENEVNWVENAKGTVSVSDRVENTVLDISEIKNRLIYIEDVRNVFSNDIGKIQYGPRWNNIENIQRDDEEGLAFIKLPQEFKDDLDEFTIHPALLDTSIGFMEKYLSSGNDYLPFAYKNMKIYAPLSNEVYSYIKKIDGLGNDMLSVSCSIADKQGNTLAEIEEFAMKKVDTNKEQKILPKDISNEVPLYMNYSLNIGEIGDIDSLYFKYSNRELVEDDEIEIEVYASSLNFKEILLATGAIKIPNGNSFEFGLECAGVISAVGKNVEGYKIGDPVIAVTTGAFSKFVKAKSKTTAHMPKGITFEEAATIPVSYMTAYYALVKRGELKKGEKVLIHAATGGVGMAAINVANMIGAEIFATCGNDEKGKYLNDLGIKHVMNSRNLDFVDEIKNNYEGVDVILNSLTGDAIEKGLTILNYHGRFLELGAKDILENTKIGMSIFEKGISFNAININSHIEEYNKILNEIVCHIEKGKLKILLHKVYKLEDIKDAFLYMISTRHIGKIVISHKYDMAEKYPEELKKSTLIDGITNSDGTDVFERIIRFVNSNFVSFGQVVVSASDFNKRLSRGAVSEQMAAVKSIKSHSEGAKKRKRPQISVDYAPPVTDIEKKLTEIIEEYLGIDKVGINDNFFEIGASSLDMIQINSKINKSYSKDTSIVKLYSYNTVQQLGKYLSDEKEVDKIDENVENEKAKSKKGLNRTLGIVKRSNQRNNR